MTALNTAPEVEPTVELVRPKVKHDQFFLQDGGQQYQRWFYRAPETHETDAMLDPAYWANVAGRIGALDQIEVLPFSLNYRAVFLVVAKTENSVRTHLLEHKKLRGHLRGEK